MHAGLERLDLSSNRIASVPADILAPLSTLQELRIAANLLTQLQLPGAAGCTTDGQPVCCAPTKQLSDRERAMKALQQQRRGNSDKAEGTVDALAAELAAQAYSSAYFCDVGALLGRQSSIRCSFQRSMRVKAA
jgi:hypothetical protein